MDGLKEVYPTHFLQAAFAAQAYGMGMDAWLFENDSAAAGRRGELAEFLSAVRGPALQRGIGLYPGLLEARLAPEPGDFRNPDCWPPAEERPGRAMVVLCDPYKLAEHSTDPLHLTAQDLAMIRDLLSERYLERPNWTANVLFIGARVQGEDCHNAIDLWVENFLPEGLAAERDCWECACVKWKGFGVLVGAYVTEGTLPDTFDDAIQEIHRVLLMTHGSKESHLKGKLWPKVIRPDSRNRGPGWNNADGKRMHQTRP